MMTLFVQFNELHHEEQRMMTYAPRLLGMDANLKNKWVCMIDCNGSQGTCVLGIFAVVCAITGAVVALVPIQTKSHNEMDSVLSGLRKRYEHLGCDLAMISTDQGRSDRQLCERNGFGTPTEDVWHVMQRVLSTVNSVKYPVQYQEFGKRLSQAFFKRAPKSNSETSSLEPQTENKSRKSNMLKDGTDIISSTHSLVTEFSRVEPGFITKKTWQAIANLKQNVEDGIFGGTSSV